MTGDFSSSFVQIWNCLCIRVFLPNMERQRKTQLKEEGMVEGEEEENMRHLCSLNFTVWAQGVSGGAEDWYWYSSMGLHAPEKRQFSQSSPLCQLAQIWKAVSLWGRDTALSNGRCWKMLEQAGFFWKTGVFFLLGNSLIILHEVMIFETSLITLLSIKEICFQHTESML